MCSGCCRYIPDHFIAKIPFIGLWLVRWNNAETGGPIFRIFRFSCRNRILHCQRVWEELADEIREEKLCPFSPHSDDSPCKIHSRPFL